MQTDEEVHTSEPLSMCFTEFVLMVCFKNSLISTNFCNQYKLSSHRRNRMHHTTKWILSSIARSYSEFYHCSAGNTYYKLNSYNQKSNA